jgi:hypothetical protein
MTGRVSEQDGWCRIWRRPRHMDRMAVHEAPDHRLAADHKPGRVSHEADAGLVGLFFADQPKMHERHFMGEV